MVAGQVVQAARLLLRHVFFHKQPRSFAQAPASAAAAGAPPAPTAPAALTAGLTLAAERYAPSTFHVPAAAAAAPARHGSATALTFQTGYQTGYPVTLHRANAGIGLGAADAAHMRPVSVAAMPR